MTILLVILSGIAVAILRAFIKAAYRVARYNRRINLLVRSYNKRLDMLFDVYRGINADRIADGREPHPWRRRFARHMARVSAEVHEAIAETEV